MSDVRTPVTRLQLALDSPGMARSATFSTRGYLRSAEPGVNEIDTEGRKEPGLFKTSVDGVEGFTWNRIEFTPFAVGGGPGAWFWVRVTGWRRLGHDPQTLVWQGRVLAEFLCVAGGIPGPARLKGGTSYDRSKVTARLIDDTDFMCDSVTLYRGSLGAGRNAGEIMQYDRGSGMPASVLMDLRGSGKFQFEFAVPHQYTYAANAVWAGA